MGEFFKCANCNFIASKNYFIRHGKGDAFCRVCDSSFKVEELIRPDEILVCELCGVIIGIDKPTDCEHPIKRYNLHKNDW